MKEFSWQFDLFLHKAFTVHLKRSQKCRLNEYRSCFFCSEAEEIEDVEPVMERYNEFIRNPKIRDACEFNWVILK